MKNQSSEQKCRDSYGVLNFCQNQFQIIKQIISEIRFRVRKTNFKVWFCGSFMKNQSLDQKYWAAYGVLNFCQSQFQINFSVNSIKQNISEIRFRVRKYSFKLWFWVPFVKFWSFGQKSWDSYRVQNFSSNLFFNEKSLIKHFRY